MMKMYRTKDGFTVIIDETLVYDADNGLLVGELMLDKKHIRYLSGRITEIGGDKHPRKRLIERVYHTMMISWQKKCPDLPF